MDSSIRGILAPDLREHFQRTLRDTFTIERELGGGRCRACSSQTKTLRPQVRNQGSPVGPFRVRVPVQEDKYHFDLGMNRVTTVPPT